MTTLESLIAAELRALAEDRRALAKLAMTPPRMLRVASVGPRWIKLRPGRHGLLAGDRVVFIAEDGASGYVAKVVEVTDRSIACASETNSTDATDLRAEIKRGHIAALTGDRQ